MPESKKRKRKNGKKLGNGEQKNFNRFSDKESGLSLQDVINMVAYQDYVADGKIDSDQVLADAKVMNPALEDVANQFGEGYVIDENAEIHIPDEIPVTIGEGDGKRQVGTATPVPGDPGAMSIQINDKAVKDMVHGPVGNYRINKEQE